MEDIFFDRTDYLTYARWSHWGEIGSYSKDLYGDFCNPLTDVLKKYQDLLVYYFILKYIPKGSKILEVGGGQSRILRRLKNDYECWNVDKLEGLGNGPKAIESENIIHIKKYIGEFSGELPSNYFDFVFSISVLEHIPQDKISFFNDIIKDMDRVMKPGSYSLHAFDIVFRSNSDDVMNRFIPFVFENVNTINSFSHPEDARLDRDLFLMSRAAYDKSWERITKQKMEKFGMPTSINALWRK